jgi:predicted transglutaminase-like cysteine proteinase
VLRAIVRVIGATLLSSGCFFAGGVPLKAGVPKATFASVGAVTAIPYGWMDFCARQPQECDQPVLAAVDVDLTLRSWEALIRINRAVNASIVPVSNLEHWGTRMDHWDYPSDGKGDCKIYALEKRRLLMAMSFPRQALLMTIVRDYNDQGHAVLTVRTTSGDFILDNLDLEMAESPSGDKRGGCSRPMKPHAGCPLFQEGIRAPPGPNCQQPQRPRMCFAKMQGAFRPATRPFAPHRTAG